ncbi:MAG: insulinase family protein [Paludibacter sp.]|nr:insulinase family protein [Paludibacter sp.]MBP6355658.1 insulinase family protein [Paludibacter sp.]MBP6634224.1 insulinase family protein [Paludibacter sp.]
MKKGFIKSVILSLLFICSASMYAQQAPEVPIDPKVRYGKLDNGLTYYIRANKLPKERAEFFIAQNVGAILENDDQNGLAHFLEHMCFNGTKNYPDKGIINYFEKIGVKFGANINAYTSLDETVYNLSDVPTIRETVIDSALLVLHDWSGFVSLLDKEIDSERGVIREEWRTGAGADRRMWKESNKLKYPGSQYAKRDVIGDTAVINNFSYKTLRDYYHKWYRPDQQAILVVGDIDVDKVEAKIKTLFADIPKKENAAERIVYPIHDNVEPIIAIVKDKEARMTRIELEYKHDKLPLEVKKSMSGYVVNVVNNLISSMLGTRFDEITQQANAPFVGGYAFYGELVKSKDAFQMMVVPNEGRELEGLQAILLEAEKVKRFGFTNSELERAKTNLLKSMENSYNDRENQKSSNLVREYVRHFTSDEVIPGIEWEYQTMQMFLPRLTADMVNQIAKSYITDNNLIVSIMAPDKEAVKIPTEEQIKAAIEESKKAELTAKAEEDLNKPLISTLPKAGKVKKVAKNDKIGTTEWTLSNGVKVIFKPTKFKEDEILLSAFSEGGLSKVKNVADLPSASLASGIVGSNGLGDYNQIELNKLLTGKIAQVSPFIGAYDEGFNGSSSVKDFETMLQLVYLQFTAPRKDDNSYAALLNMYRASLSNIASDPRKAFSDSVNTLINNRHARTVIQSLEMLDKINQDVAIAIYKERFAAPADFTFVFTGNIDPANEGVKNAICTYLGGIKSSKGGEKFTDNNIRKPKGEVKNYFRKEMKINKASNFILYSAEMPYNITNRTAVTAIGSILSMRYLESIREKEGGSYGVSVRGSVGNTPIADATLLMQFDTDPEKQQKLIGIIHSEVKEIVTNGPKASDLQKVKENMLKKFTEDMAENNWWNSAVVRYYQDKLDLVNDYKASVEALTPELIQSTLKSITDKGNVLEVVMLPAE